VRPADGLGGLGPPPPGWALDAWALDAWAALPSTPPLAFALRWEVEAFRYQVELFRATAADVPTGQWPYGSTGQLSPRLGGVPGSAYSSGR
jgi:hypothetical protein